MLRAEEDNVRELHLFICFTRPRHTRNVKRHSNTTLLQQN